MGLLQGIDEGIHQMIVHQTGQVTFRQEVKEAMMSVITETPPRVGGNPGGVTGSGSSRRRNSRDVDYGGQDYDYQRRDKRSDRLKESRHGPTKTSSPMM